jgi:hypothetical protein
MKAIERSGRAQVTARPRPATAVRHRNPLIVQADRDSPEAGAQLAIELHVAATLSPLAQLTPVTRSSGDSLLVCRQARAVIPVGPSAPLWWASVVSVPPEVVVCVD